MSSPLFSITCTTCGRLLAVSDPAAVGAIAICPKCGSMVLIMPRCEGQPGEPPEAAATSPAVEEPPARAPTPERIAAPEASAAAIPIKPPPLPPMTSAAAAQVAGEYVPASLIWRTWLVLLGVPLASVILLAGLWMVLSSRSSPPQPAVAVAPAAPPTPATTAPAVKEPAPAPTSLDLRWVPDRTEFFFCLKLPPAGPSADLERLVAEAAPLWQPFLGDVVKSFGLRASAVRGMSLASTNLAAPAEHCVVVISLQANHDARVFRDLGEAMDLSLDGVPCRRLEGAAWSHPYAVLDEHTIVTGRGELLRELASRSEPHLASAAVDRLARSMPPDADLLLLLDLVAARQARWPLPVNLLDVWPTGRVAWHALWEVPDGLGLEVQLADGKSCKLGLVCESESGAAAVRDALDGLVPAAKQAIAARMASLAKTAEEGQTAAAAQPYQMSLQGALANLEKAKWELADTTIWLRLAWPENAARLAESVLESRPAIRSEWLTAARLADQAKQEQLLSGLDGYRQTEGHLPAGAVGSVLLEPETRLSWIATMLPYYGYDSWYKRLEFGYAWNGPQNRPVTRQALEPVVNPALGPSQTEAGFPVTHYAGVTGVGADAGRLVKDDPRAGVFGFGRTTRTEDITDGASNTVAILGVTSKLGAWASGGQPTARPLTKPPYVDGPDGFGSGQPDGMLAGMADGSVRFLSKDVDPRVLEQMATIHGEKEAPASPVEKPQTPAPAVSEPIAPAASTSTGADEAIRTRLAERIPRIAFRDKPLSDVIEFLATLGDFQVTFDLPAMGRLGVALDDPVTVELSDATLADVLEQILSERGLSYAIASGQVLLGAPPESEGKLRPVVLHVSDLTERKPTAFIVMVRELIAPESWREAGGKGVLRTDGPAIVVTQSDLVQRQLLEFCEKLRLARGKPLANSENRGQILLKTRWALARPKLETKLSANFGEPTPLGNILAYLAEHAGVSIQTDWLALGTLGVSADSKTSLAAHDRPLSEALAAVLRPLELAFLAVDGQTLQVTTRKAAAGRMELEFYPVADLMATGLAGRELVERVKDQLAGATWSDTGGAGAIRFDASSRCLLVLQSQPMQIDLEGLLARWRAERKK